MTEEELSSELFLGKPPEQQPGCLTAINTVGLSAGSEEKHSKL